MKRILINATQAEELRVAMVDGQLLYDLDIENPSREQKKANIYKGVITRVEPSLEAAFVNYGAERHGFLPFKEISRNYFAADAKSENGRYNIKDAVKEGQEIIVQVEKEERGNKGAALTSFISLAGRFLVAMPQNPRAGGVSRRIEGEERDQIRKIMSELEMPKGMGVIARTAGVGRTTEEMQWDLDYLCQLWTAVEQAAAEKPAPFLIYQESDIVIRALRDHFKNDIGEIIIDSQKAYDRAHEFMSMVMPNAIHKLKKFEDNIPLFNRYQVESQIESAFAREVTLSSGGAIVIDHTEALISIDVNSARATKGRDIEDTALNTNLEAAAEIARQLRIRDLGGLVVIDFIDMMKNKNQREVETRLRQSVQEDRARVQIGRISRFGLLEMSRQRLRPSLGESSQIVCPRCSGQGSIRDIESLSLSVLRLLEEDALKENTGRLVAKLPVECATYLLNEKRNKIDSIEQRNNVHCVIIPDPNLETPHFDIERVRENDTIRHESSYKNSYEMTTEETSNYTPEIRPTAAAPAQAAAVQRITPPSPKPQSTAASANDSEQKKEGGLISKFISAIFGGTDEPEAEEKPAQRTSSQSRNRNQSSQNRNRNRSNQNRNRNKNSRGNTRNAQGGQNQSKGNQGGNKQAGGNNQGNQGNQGNQKKPNRNPRNNNAERQNDTKKQDSQGNQSTAPTEQQDKPENQGNQKRQQKPRGNRVRGPRRNPTRQKLEQNPTPGAADSANGNTAEDNTAKSSADSNRPQSDGNVDKRPAQKPAEKNTADTSGNVKPAQAKSQKIDKKNDKATDGQQPGQSKDKADNKSVDTSQAVPEVADKKPSTTRSDSKAAQKPAAGNKAAAPEPARESTAPADKPAHKAPATAANRKPAKTADSSPKSENSPAQPPAQAVAEKKQQAAPAEKPSTQSSNDDDRPSGEPKKASDSKPADNKAAKAPAKKPAKKAAAPSKASSSAKAKDRPAETAAAKKAQPASDDNNSPSSNSKPAAAPAAASTPLKSED